MKFVTFLAVAAVAALTGVGDAAAAQRYAAPEGNGGEPCAKEAPCSLQNAVANAKSGDEVIVEAGTYPLGETYLLPSAPNLDIHGDLAGPRPKITATDVGSPIFFTEPGIRLSYLEISNSGTTPGGIRCAAGGRIERVRATAIGESAVGVGLGADCIVRDTVARAEGANSIALGASGVDTTGVVRNVTAIATGAGSTGIQSHYGEFSTPGAYTLDVKNTIASGAAADIVASQPGAGGADGPGNVTVSNSNFRLATTEGTGSVAAVTLGAGNQTAAPLFVNAAVGDYREAPGSPTIDGGVADQLGATDFDGNPRVLGAAPDIGAYEFVPPAIQPGVGATIQSLAVKPRAFQAANIGGAVVSRRRAKPVGGEVSYSLSGAGAVAFTVEHAVSGRRAGGKCRGATRTNRSHGKCTLYKPLKGAFSASGAAGANSFKFSGRLGGKSLKPGSYRLLGIAGGATKEAAFTIVK